MQSMNNKQEQLAEKIIALHKEGDGVFEWDNLHYRGEQVFPEEWGDRKKADQLRFIRGVFQEMELVEFLDEEENLSRLTRKGMVFSSFFKIKEQEVEEQRLNNVSVGKLQLEVQELREKMFGYEKKQKQDSRLVLYAALSALAAIVSAIIAIFK